MRARPYKYLFPGQKLHGQMKPLRALDVWAGRQSPKCQTASEKPPSSGGFFGSWGRGPRSTSGGGGPAHGGPATLRPCPPSDSGRRGGTGDAAHTGPGPLGLSHLLEKIEQSFENRTKLQAPCNRWAVSTHDNKELVKSFHFTLSASPSNHALLPYSLSLLPLK